MDDRLHAAIPVFCRERSYFANSKKGGIFKPLSRLINLASSVKLRWAAARAAVNKEKLSNVE
jgi:hypothetical protein